MDNYKIINTEIIMQNVEMRESIASYKSHVVLLQKELLDERRTKAELKQRFVEIITKNLWGMKNFLLDVDVDIKDLLKFNDPSDNHEGNMDKENEVRSSESRRSSQILQELRQSIAVQRRSSVITTSPISQKQNIDENSTAEKEDQEIGRYREEEYALPIILESNEIEEEISQKLNSIAISPSPRTRRRELNVYHSSRFETSQDDSLLTSPELHVEEVPHIVIRRGKHRYHRERTIDIPQITVSLQAESNEFLKSPMNNSISLSESHKEDDTRLNSVMNDITNINISHVPCSTPKSQIYDTDNETLVPKETEENCMTSTSSLIESNRPQRKCKPRNLAEPGVGYKMRNENSRPSKRKTKKK